MDVDLSPEEYRRLILRGLPELLRKDPSLRHELEAVLAGRFAEKEPFEARFDRLMEELRLDREEQSRKWDEQNRKWDEQNRKWDEQNRKWDEQTRKWDEQKSNWDENQATIKEMLAEIRRVDRRIDSTIGAVGARWGVLSESAFREALQAILTESFDVTVERFIKKDEAGHVFGRPDQVEIDVVIRNGSAIVIELKSSISAAEVYVFERKAVFYEQQTGRKVTRMIVVSPMIDPRALKVAKSIGIETYPSVWDLNLEES